MSDQLVVDHYRQSDLLSSFEKAVRQAGKTPETITVADLAPADEFHIGGSSATEHLLDQLDLAPSSHVLDVGCGIGGPARCAAARYEQVTGVDLTAEYVETGNAITQWVGLHDRVELHVGSALDMTFANASFDGGYMIHVGMNIENKQQLMSEVARVLKPGSRFGVYDIMRVGDADLEFPVPWSSDPVTSHVVSADHYKQAASNAGLSVLAENNRADQAKATFDQLGQRPKPSPLGLHLVMGSTVAEKVKNMVFNVQSGRIAPVELILQR